MAWTTPGTATAGEVLTAAFWNTNVRDNSNALYGAVRRLAYIERTTTYSANQTALASATDVFSSDLTWTATGATYIIEFFGLVQVAGLDGFTRMILTDGGNNGLGALGVAYTGTQGSITPLFARKYYTPAAGTTTINVRGIYATNGPGSLNAGDGTGTNNPVAFLAVYGPILT